MLKKILGKRGQSTAEYAIIIAIVVGAVVAMQVYVKRGVQARIHDVVGYTGAETSNKITSNQGTVDNPFTGSQYEPYYAGSDMNVTRDAQSTDTLSTGGGRTLSTAETTTRTGLQTVGNVQNK